ncbi:MAG: hypothetical protein ACKVK6_10875, partial [bacterium]
MDSPDGTEPKDAGRPKRRRHRNRGPRASDDKTPDTPGESKAEGQQKSERGHRPDAGRQGGSRRG